MEGLAFKIRLAVLWLFWIVAFLALMMMAFFETGTIEQIIAGEFAGLQITSELMFVTAILMLVPLVMAFLSVTLKDKANRWANMVIGIAYTGICLFDLIGGLAVPPAYTLLMQTSLIIVPALIVWHAYKWKV